MMCCAVQFAGLLRSEQMPPGNANVWQERNRVRVTRNHPPAALKWNHNLADAAIGWS